MCRFTNRLLSPLTAIALLSVLAACDEGPGAVLEPELAVEREVFAGSMSPVPRPFHGRTRGRLAELSMPPNRCPATHPFLFIWRGEGRFIHMGRTTLEASECNYLDDPFNPTVIESVDGEMKLTAANGDWIRMTYEDLTFTFHLDPPIIDWHANPVVVEGSGRFEDVDSEDLVWDVSHDPLTGAARSTFDGRIRY